MHKAIKYLLAFTLAAFLLVMWKGHDALRGDIGLMEVEDVIQDVRPHLDLLKHYEDAPDIKAIVVRIDSPGGMVGPTQELFYALREVGETKPVVASLGSVAASGGYYVACAAKRIVANPGTITGSIGVLFPYVDASDLIRFFKLKPGVIKSAPFKDLNAPYRSLREEERAHLQDIVNSLHVQFKQAVLAGRNMAAEQVDRVADGRIFTGAQAKDLGLVDDLGGLREAIRIAAELAGISKSPTIARPPRKSFFDRLFSPRDQYQARFPWPGAGGVAKPLLIAY